MLYEPEYEYEDVSTSTENVFFTQGCQGTPADQSAPFEPQLAPHMGRCSMRSEPRTAMTYSATSAIDPTQQGKEHSQLSPKAWYLSRLHFRHPSSLSFTQLHTSDSYIRIHTSSSLIAKTHRIFDSLNQPSTCLSPLRKSTLSSCSRSLSRCDRTI